MGLYNIIHGISPNLIKEERATWVIGYERDGKEYSWSTSANTSADAQRAFDDYMEGQGVDPTEYRVKGTYQSTTNDKMDESPNPFATEDEITEENSTSNLDGGLGQPKIPGIFQRNNPTASDKRKERKNATSSTGYNITTKTNNYIKRRDEIFSRAEDLITKLDEARYADYAADESMTAKEKINSSIRDVNRKLYEIEHMIDHAVRLKTESGIEDVFWKPTRDKFAKISERMIRISTKLREFNK